jgi:hypothetical protein
VQRDGDIAFLEASLLDSDGTIIAFLSRFCLALIGVMFPRSSRRRAADEVAGREQKRQGAVHLHHLLE